MFTWISQVFAVTQFSMRSLPQRKGSSAAAMIGITGVVAVMVGVLSIAQGILRTMESSAGDVNAIVLRSGSDSEMMSGLAGEDARIIAEAPGISRDESGAIIASVGIKTHDAVGHELAVVTEEGARGKGLARRLVATAARRILDDGGVPTYLHEPSNTASARVAEAVGFVDQGWTVHGLWPRR